MYTRRRECIRAGECTPVIPSPGAAVPHKPPTHKLRQLRQPDPRPSAHRRGYGVAWQCLRLAVLAEEPLCRHCMLVGRVTAAVHVDHIVPRERGGTDERCNLQGLCPYHHNQKTATLDGGFGRNPRSGVPRNETPESLADTYFANLF